MEDVNQQVYRDTNPLLNQNRAVIYPQVQQAPPVRRCCRRGRLRAFMRNHKKCLKVNLILHIVLAVLGALITTPVITILRIVSSVVGLRSLKRRSPLLLVVFGGIYDIFLTLSAPWLTTVFGVFFNVRSSGNDGGSLKVLGFSVVLSLVHSLLVLINQITSLYRCVKLYKEEKLKHANPQPEQAQPVQELRDRSVVPIEPVSYVSPVQAHPNQSMIVSLPPPPQETCVVGSAPQIEEFQAELKLLREMGFGDEGRNLQMLRTHKGNIQNVIQTYISK